MELALSMQHRLKQLYREAGRDPALVVVGIVNRGKTVLSSHNRRVGAPCRSHIGAGWKLGELREQRRGQRRPDREGMGCSKDFSSAGESEDVS